MEDLEIVCIKDKLDSQVKNILECYLIDCPVLGTRYTIRDIVHNPDGNYGVLLNEIVNSININCHPLLNHNSGEQNWDMRNFKFTDKTLRLKYSNVWKWYRSIILREDEEEIKFATETIENSD